MGDRAEVLLPASAATTPRSTRSATSGSAGRSRWPTRQDRRARLAGHHGPRRLAVQAGGPDLGAAQPALLRGDAAASKAIASSTSSPKRRSPTRPASTLSQKVEVVEDPAITARGAKFRHMVRVDVHLKDGSVESETREAPRGSEQSFATSEEIVDKFRKLTRAVMPKGQQDALVQAVLGMEDLPKAKDLIRLLRTEGR